jgi:HK97 family phage portal protein
MLLKASTIFELQAQQRRMVEQCAVSRVSSVRERSYSNEEITPEIAITSSAVISIITLLAQDLASIPLILHARKGRAKFRAYDHPYYRLMHNQPNPEMSSVTFRELIVSYKIGWGNFFAQKIWDKAGVVQELWPLRPDRMRVERIDGEKVYIYQPASGGKPIVFFADEILHIPGFGFDGLVGQSRIALARNAIGSAISMEKFGGTLFANGANVGIIYKHPGELGDKAYDRLKESLVVEHAGVENAHKPIILEEGMSIDRLGIPPDDAQFIESRKFQLAEINRIIGPVPPHLIGDMDKSTSWGTGIDSQEQGYINHSVMPIARRIEQSLDNQLLLETDRADGYFYEHLFDGFLRGDIQTRYEAYTKAITNGFMSRNEAREKENMNPRAGLDEMLQPLNMTPAGSSSSSGEQQQNALAPLFREVVNRVVKREMQDLHGAERRTLAKGQLDEWHAWLDQFYGEDHPAFVFRQFEALCEAQTRLFGSETTQVNDYFTDYMARRREELRHESAEAVEGFIDEWSKSLPDAMANHILKMLEVCDEDIR